MRYIKALVVTVGLAAGLSAMAAIARDASAKAPSGPAKPPSATAEARAPTMGPAFVISVLEPGASPAWFVTPPVVSMARVRDFPVVAPISNAIERDMRALVADMRGWPIDAAAWPAGSHPADLAALAPAGASVSDVSTYLGGHACTRTFEVASKGPEQRPLVVSRHYGDCAAASSPPASSSPRRT